MEKVYTYQGGVSFGGDIPTAEFDFEMNYQLGEDGGVTSAEVITVDGKSRPWNRCGGIPDDELADAIIEHLDFIGVDLVAHAAETEASMGTMQSLLDAICGIDR